MRARWVTAAAVAGCALAFAACGFEDPYEDREPEPTRQADQAPARQSDERPPADRRDPDDYRDQPVVKSGDAAELAAAYGLASGNWSWRTYADQYSHLLALAGGELRDELQSTPPDPGVVRSLRRARQTNSAELVGVDARDGAVIVVLRERAGARGRLDVSPVHTVYRAEVDGRRVTSWERLP